jgi:hypothetical protein
MRLYLKWLNLYEKQEHEKEPIGLILTLVFPAPIRTPKRHKMRKFYPPL